MDPVFDTSLVVRRKLRALASGNTVTFLMDHVAAELADRLGAVGRHFPKAATIFTPTDAPAAALLGSGKVDEIVAIEADSVLLAARPGIVIAPETLPLEPESLDLAVSLLSLHEVNDIPGLLAQIRRALKPDGLFLAAMAGAGTLAELRESLLAAETELYGGASPRVSPFADVRDTGALLQRAGFALPVADIDALTVRYDSLYGLMRDLRGMGATNALHARSRRPVSRELFLRAAELYAERFADPDGRIRATFSIIWLSGWAPHVSQQAPLKPGSAKISLKDVLERGGS